VKHLLIVYASQTGHALRMAQAARQGALVLADEVEVRIEHGLRAGLDELLWCHGLLLATPENFGYMAGALKDFFDRTFYPAQGLVEGLPFAVMISAGNDGSGALTAIERIARGYPLQRVIEPVIAKGELTDEALARCFDMGQTMAAGIAYGMF